MNKKGSRIPISRVLSRSVSTSEPVICLVPGSPRGSSVLPSIALLGRATLSRWYTRTCSSQRTQPDDHPPAGGLLHHLLTLAFPGKAVVFFCLSLPSPTASIFRSGTPYAARTFPRAIDTSDKPRFCFHMQSYVFFMKIDVFFHFSSHFARYLRKNT